MFSKLFGDRHSEKKIATDFDELIERLENNPQMHEYIAEVLVALISKFSELYSQELPESRRKNFPNYINPERLQDEAKNLVQQARQNAKSTDEAKKLLSISQQLLASCIIALSWKGEQIPDRIRPGQINDIYNSKAYVSGAILDRNARFLEANGKAIPHVIESEDTRAFMRGLEDGG